MHAFACPHCRALVVFESTTCLTCGHELAYDRAQRTLVELFATGAACAQRALIGCNWLAEPGGSEGLCASCALTRTRPADGPGSNADAVAAWSRTEAAKRRLVFQLDVLGLPVVSRAQDPEQGLAFDLLSSDDDAVTTGHADGVITIDLAESDDAHRESLRVQLAEPYRTMLGHLRHEIGHWYWQVLVDGTGFLDAFRDLFGDERVDYSQALQEHYSGPITDEWTHDYVSHYAAAHPWEDWAESFAHYLHIRDSLETAGAWGVTVAGPDLDLNLAWDAQLAVDPAEEPGSFGGLVRAWLPFTFAMNALNRSMGKDDFYPFVLPPRALEKLRFVHVVVGAVRPAAAATS